MLPVLLEQHMAEQASVLRVRARSGAMERGGSLIVLAGSGR